MDLVASPSGTRQAAGVSHRAGGSSRRRTLVAETTGALALSIAALAALLLRRRMRRRRHGGERSGEGMPAAASPRQQARSVVSPSVQARPKPRREFRVKRSRDDVPNAVDTDIQQATQAQAQAQAHSRQQDAMAEEEAASAPVPQFLQLLQS